MISAISNTPGNFARKLPELGPYLKWTTRFHHASGGVEM